MPRRSGDEKTIKELEIKLYYINVTALVIFFVAWPLSEAAILINDCNSDSNIVETSIKEVSQLERQFSINLYKEIVKDGAHKNGNAAVAGASVFLTLLMVYHGSTGETNKQLKTALGIKSTYENSYCGYKSIVDKLENLDLDTLKYAGSITFHNAITVDEKYENLLKSTFNYDVNYGNLAMGKGFDRIQLQGAAILRMPWIEDFKLCTVDAHLQFISNKPGVMKRLYYYHKNDIFNYGELENGEFLEIPMKLHTGNDKFSAFVVLPSKKVGLEKMESHLDDKMLLQLVKNGKKTKIDVDIPMFNIDDADSIEETLKKMKIKNLFTDKPDLEEIAKGSKIKVNDFMNYGMTLGEDFGAVRNAKNCVHEIKGSKNGHSFIVNRPFMVLVIYKDAINPLVVSISRFVIPH